MYCPYSNRVVVEVDVVKLSCMQNTAFEHSNVSVFDMVTCLYFSARTLIFNVQKLNVNAFFCETEAEGFFFFIHRNNVSQVTTPALLNTVHSSCCDNVLPSKGMQYQNTLVQVFKINSRGQEASNSERWNKGRRNNDKN